MKLEKIEICNFRSIKNETVNFTQGCMVLIGKNEAGKTNVMKAIASVFGQYKVSDKDKRKKIGDEKIEKSDIMAILKLNSSDLLEIENRFLKKYSGTNLIKFKSGITLGQYIAKVFRDFIISIEIGNEKTPYYTYWEYNKTDFELVVNPRIANGFLNLVGEVFNIETSMFNIVKELYLENPYRCHYWQYNDSYLLPSSINIGDFATNPSKCKALENIFILAGRENIKKELSEAKSADGDYFNIFDLVSKKTSSTFQKIWKDFKDTSIQLLPDGELIRIKVVDKAKYTFDDRSDGFKKFISILLMISTQARAKRIFDKDLILIDEPDQSLYPTSAQYLRDELIEISKNSIVVYSTHSQYMIDSNCLERHIIVEKKNDVTTLKIGNAKANYTTDALLRQVIGVSIFECLKEKNIIFEGFLDRQLFNKYLIFSKLDKEFMANGQVYLSGISGAELLVQILILANKKFLIVADSDQTSKHKREDFDINYSEFSSSWLGYADKCNGVETMEDFLKPAYIQKQIIALGHKKFIYDESITAIKNIESIDRGNKELKQEIKVQLVKSVSKADFKPSYKVFVDFLREKLLQL